MKILYILLLILLVIFIILSIRHIYKPNTKDFWNFEKFLEKNIDKKTIKNKIANIPIYVINLKHHIRRRNRILKQASLTGLNINIVDGVYGKTIDLSKNHVNGLKYSLKYKLTNSLSELGCVLSHLKTFLEILKNETDDVFLVLEDDVLLYTIQYIEDSVHNILKKLPTDWDYFSLYKDCRKENNNDDIFLNYTNNKCYGNVAYIINRKAIYKLLKIFNYTDMHGFILDKRDISSDILIPHVLNSYNHYKGVIIPLNTDEINSTIHKDHTKGHLKLQHKYIKYFLNNILTTDELQKFKRFCKLSV